MANLIGVVFGVFMYFPMLVEVPIANMFLGLGMHRGPLLQSHEAEVAVGGLADGDEAVEVLAWLPRLINDTRP